MREGRATSISTRVSNIQVDSDGGVNVCYNRCNSKRFVVSEKGAVVALEVFTSDEKMEKEKVGFDRDDEFMYSQAGVSGNALTAERKTPSRHSQTIEILLSWLCFYTRFCQTVCLLDD
jgi:hypothetical protein